MKNKLLPVFLLSLLFFLSAQAGLSQTKKLIHYWHFNCTTTGIHMVSIPADYSTLGNASVNYKPIPGGGPDTTNVNDFMDNYTGDTINQRLGYLGTCIGVFSVRTRNPSDNMQFLWYMPTTGYQNIVIKYETQSSSTTSGQHRQLYAYSLDSAKTFINTGLPLQYDSAGTGWGKVVLDLSSLTSVNNNKKLVFRITFAPPNTGTNGNNRFDNITVEGDTMIAPSFISNPLTEGILGRAYSYTMRAGGSPAPAFSVTGNPAWLSLNDSILSGTPADTGSFGPIVITATNALGSVHQSYTLTISDSIVPVAPAITSTAPATGMVNSLYTYNIKATGVPKPALSVSGNPSWLTLADSTLSGTPPSDGVFGPITITATNIEGTAQQLFTLTVPAAPQITSTAVTMGVEGIAYTYTITITGTPAPSLSVSGNPSWLTLNGNILSGIPTSTGTTGSITITATNTQGSDQQVFSIDVASVPKITSTPVTSAIAGSSYTYNVTATGTPAPEYSISGNPSWLSVTGSTISGIPESSGLIGPITVTATNVASSDAQTFYIYVNNPAVNTSAEKLIHYWHFNNTLPVDGSGGIYFGPNPIPADFSIIGGAALVYKPLSGVVSDTGQVDNLVGDTLNQRMGFGGCCGDVNNAIRTRNPSDSMQFLWYIPTKSYKNIVIKYETELSSLKSGQHEQIFSYSLDSAMTFINNGLPVLSNFADTVWQVVTLDLRSIPEVNDNNNLVLRILYSAPNTGSKGNNRFDNITVEGDKIPVEYVMPEYESEGYSLYPNPASDYITLTSDNDGNRKIEIFNSAGILINQTVMTDRQLLINTSKLSPGLYFVKIKDSNHGIIIKLKFIKQ